MASNNYFSVFGNQFQGHLATDKVTEEKQLSPKAGKAVSFSLVSRLTKKMLIESNDTLS